MTTIEMELHMNSIAETSTQPTIVRSHALYKNRELRPDHTSKRSLVSLHLDNFWMAANPGGLTMFQSVCVSKTEGGVPADRCNYPVDNY